MKPNTTKTLAAWHVEITQELVDARQALPPLQAELQAAEAALETVRADTGELQRTLDGLARFAPAISARLSFQLATADEARRNRDRGRATLANARARVAELQQALRQLDALLLVDDAEAA